jgi:hypothetical protein
LVLLSVYEVQKDLTLCVQVQHAKHHCANSEQVLSLKNAIKHMPLLGPVAVRLKRYLAPGAGAAKPFAGSADYWESRYRTGGDSGAGSYNRLAEFKAEFLNGFVADHKILSVIEFGSGDCAQLKLARYPAYIGVDVAPAAVEMGRAQFGTEAGYSFYHTSELPADLTAELSLSLDVIYHLVEDSVFERYMNQLFDAATRYVIVYASNEDRAWSSPHVRHRKFTQWIDEHRSDFTLIERVPNKYPFDEKDQDNTSFADFYVFARN